MVLFIFLTFGVTVSADTLDTSGSSPIVNGNLRAAKKTAISDALLLSIRSYYESTAAIRGGVIPDVTEEYLKYIENYIIIFNGIEDNAYAVSLKVNLDTIGLNDAKQITTPHVNTAVFTFTGIAKTLISSNRISEIVSSILKSNNFALTEQKSFEYVSSDMTDEKALLDAFTDLNSKYYFQFSFESSFINLKKPANRCELITYTAMNTKAGKGNTFKLETSSNLTNQSACIEEALIAAVASTVEYVRDKMIQKPVKNSNESNTIHIRAVNFNSMLDVNNFISKLKNRGYISSQKTVSFAPKDVTIAVESLLDVESLSNKIPAINTDFALQFSIESDTLIIDFAKR